MKKWRENTRSKEEQRRDAGSGKRTRKKNQERRHYQGQEKKQNQTFENNSMGEELYPENGTTIKVTKNTFLDKESKYVKVVHFYRNDSKESQQIKGVLERLFRNDLYDTFKLSAVNCGEMEDRVFCSEVIDSEIGVALVVNRKVTIFPKEKILFNRMGDAILRDFIKANMPYDFLPEIKNTQDIRTKLQNKIDKTLVCTHLEKDDTQRHKLAVVYITAQEERSASLASIAHAYKDVITFGEM
eukprot:CAMPEP_0113321486 /NCGR_PEP_ID=MMETSP0010_2-20120614/14955_1 /TAXON_ID=216773 ORGANISM="Corethron hystrix, Strain 308" /NCGR_SAMPLE_ID=MMETSP0010_2 /ASSEMBLY_ACC=CAM_ASM_000155 /LENGTH=241 /DNA_ID=CAMNT_0000179637 /DNA_START=64 /DNA_END=786 /DNA_ORIENTATION=- /assembly_acc=CAM_ASM_000155